MKRPYHTWFPNGGLPPAIFQTTEEMRRITEDELWSGWDYTLRVVPWDGQS
jgi:hypothetical protein